MSLSNNPICTDCGEIRIWLDRILEPASQLKWLDRKALAAAMRREIVRVRKFRFFNPGNQYHNYIALACGELTVIAMEGNVYFCFYLGDSDDPLPPEPPLNATKKIILSLQDVVAMFRNLISFNVPLTLQRPG
jgi:hypothetical protein